MGANRLYMCIPALFLIEMLQFSSPALAHEETRPIGWGKICSSLSSVAGSIDSWLSISGNRSTRDRPYSSEVLDMSFFEMQTIADFTSDDIMSLINHIIKEISISPFNAKFSGFTCLQRYLGGSDFAIRVQMGRHSQDNETATISTMVQNCCNELEIQQKNRTESAVPDSATLDQMANYTIPDAYNVYKNRTWMVS
jgi:hypothetical protein